MPHQCTTCGRTFPDGSKEMLSGCPDCGGNKFQFAPSLETRSSAGEDSDRSEPPESAEPSSAAETSVHAENGPTTPRSGDDSRPRTSNSGPDRRERTHPSEWGRSADRTRERTADREDDEWQWPESGRRPEDRDPGGRTAAGDPTPNSATNSRSPRDADNSRSPGDADSRRSDRAPDDDDPGSSETKTADPEIDDHEDTAQASARSDVVSTDELPPIDGVERPDPEGGRVVSEPSSDRPSLEELREELNQQFESIKIVSPGQYELNLMELYNRDEYIISLQEDGRYVIDVPDSWRQTDEE